MNATNTVQAAISAFASEHLAAGTLWLGYSGGLDSSVLLHALAQEPALKPRLKAIHVHHGLSPNANAWLAHCQTQSDALGVPLVAEHVQLDDCPDGIEQAARAARYGVYQRHTQPGDALLLAHHGDDQLETFLMRFVRGSGLAGLAAMAPKRELKPDVLLYRPLLGLLREVLERYGEQHGLSWVEDESNQDTSYSRNWWRHELRQVEARFPRQKQAMLRTVQQLGQDQALLAELLAPSVASVCRPWAWPNCAPMACHIPSLLALPQSQRPYVVKAWLQQLGLSLPSLRWLSELERLLSSGPDRQPQLVVGSWQLLRHQELLYLYQAPQVLAESVTLDLSQNGINQTWRGGQLVATAATVGLASGRYLVQPACLALGSSMKMAGRPHKTLKHIFQEGRVPVPLREYWPVLMQGSDLCAVVGFGIAERYERASGVMVQWK